jgi:hypothetical protein
MTLACSPLSFPKLAASTFPTLVARFPLALLSCEKGKCARSHSGKADVMCVAKL